MNAHTALASASLDLRSRISIMSPIAADAAAGSNSEGHSSLAPYGIGVLILTRFDLGLTGAAGLGCSAAGSSLPQAIRQTAPRTSRASVGVRIGRENSTVRKCVRRP